MMAQTQNHNAIASLAEPGDETTAPALPSAQDPKPHQTTQALPAMRTTRRFIRPLIAAMIMGMLAAAFHMAAPLAAAEPSDAFEQAFASPPPEARPGWFGLFYNGLITERGMTADLEAVAVPSVLDTQCAGKSR